MVIRVAKTPQAEVELKRSKCAKSSCLSRSRCDIGDDDGGRQGEQCSRPDASHKEIPNHLHGGAMRERRPAFPTQASGVGPEMVRRSYTSRSRLDARNFHV